MNVILAMRRDTIDGGWRRATRLSAMERIRQLIGDAQRWVEGTILWRFWERLLENEFLDRAVALAAKAFVSFFPALIVVASFAPDAVRESIHDAMVRRIGLSGEGLDTFRTAFASSDDIRRSTGILGLLFTFFFVNSFTNALGRTYSRAWRRPKLRRVSAYATGAGWLAGVVAYFALVGGLRAVFGRGPQTAGFAVVAWLCAIGLWTVTPWFMLQRQVRLRVLLPTGVLTATGMLFYAGTSSLWMPRTITENQHQFGFFGVALTMVTWLTGMAMVVVFAACIAPVLADDQGVLGRFVRGGDDAPTLAPGALPPLPPPARAPVLADAIAFPRGSESGDESEDP
jgi:uncharacterized BrkB/YihY/UPF0761 family membrane protein